MAERILIIGGTGMLGQPVAEQLQRDGFDVTIMSTRPQQATDRLGGKFRVVGGDVTDIESLKPAIEEMDFVYLNLNARLDPQLYERIEIGGATNASEVARQMGVKRVGYISGASSRGVPTGVIYRDAKVRAENALKESGVPYTIMRPSWFFESLPGFLQRGKCAIPGDQPVPFGWLAAQDYARQVSAAFRTDRAADKCFFNLGPQKMTMMEALTAFCARHYPDRTPEVVSFKQARLLSHLPGMADLRRTIPFFEYFSTNDEDVDPSEANLVLGPNRTTLDEWLERYEISD